MHVGDLQTLIKVVLDQEHSPSDYFIDCAVLIHPRGDLDH